MHIFYASSALSSGYIHTAEGAPRERSIFFFFFFFFTKYFLARVSFRFRAGVGYCATVEDDTRLATKLDDCHVNWTPC